MLSGPLVCPWGLPWAHLPAPAYHAIRCVELYEGMLHKAAPAVVSACSYAHGMLRALMQSERTRQERLTVPGKNASVRGETGSVRHVACMCPATCSLANSRMLCTRGINAVALCILTHSVVLGAQLNCGIAALGHQPSVRCRPDENSTA